MPEMTPIPPDTVTATMIAAKYQDSEGRPPKYTFFYPEEEYRPHLIEPLAKIIDILRRGGRTISLWCGGVVQIATVASRGPSPCKVAPDGPIFTGMSPGP